MIINQWQIGWLEEDINRGFAKEDFFNSPAWKIPNILGSPLPNAGEGMGVRGSTRIAQCLEELEMVVNTGQALQLRKAHDE
jgi:hypothetical protein